MERIKKEKKKKNKKHETTETYINPLLKIKMISHSVKIKEYVQISYIRPAITCAFKTEATQ